MNKVFALWIRQYGRFHVQHKAMNNTDLSVNADSNMAMYSIYIEE